MLFLFREGYFLFKVLELGWKLSTAPELAEEFLASKTVTRTDSDSAQALEAPVFSISGTFRRFHSKRLTTIQSYVVLYQEAAMESYNFIPSELLSCYQIQYN